MNALQKWTLSLAGTAIAAGISYQWLDRPIALFFHKTVARPETFAKLTYAPDPMVPLAVTVFVVLGLMKQRAERHEQLAATHTAEHHGFRRAT